MLVSVARLVRSSRVNKPTKIARRNLSGVGPAFPRTPVLVSVLENGKKLADKGIDQLSASRTEFVAAKQAILKSISEQESQAISPSLRSVYSNLRGSIAAIELPEIDQKQYERISSANLDDIMEVHGVGELFDVYYDAVASLPLDASVEASNLEIHKRLDEMGADHAAAIAALKAAHEKTLEKKKSYSEEAIGLMYAKADDMLMRYPHLEAAMEAEIKESRWDILTKDEEN